jgi:hypothetical protein
MPSPLKLISFLSSLRAISAAASNNYSPFLDPILNEEARSPLLLERRQQCANNGVSCGNLNNALCCPEDTICANDSAGNVGCCPIAAVCTGTVNGQPVTATGTVSETGTTGFVLGATTAAASTTITQISQTTNGGSLQIPSTGVSGGGSTVQAAGFVFTYIPTSYANAQLCQTAYSVCQQQSTACLQSLGGANGVTVGVLGGGGTTVTGGNGGATVTNAASVCSSLSSQACYGLQEQQCTNFGGATGAVVTASGNAAGPRQTACPGMVYAAAGAGVAYGAMRELL